VLGRAWQVRPGIESSSGLTMPPVQDQRRSTPGRWAAASWEVEGWPRLPDDEWTYAPAHALGEPPAGWPVYVAPLALRGVYLYAFDTPYSAWDGVNPSDLSWPTRPDSENDEYSR
jgi:hypothetical protein